MGQIKIWPFFTGDFLIDVHFIWNVLWHDKEMLPLITGDCLIEVTHGHVWLYIIMLFLIPTCRIDIQRDTYTQHIYVGLNTVSKWTSTELHIT